MNFVELNNKKYKAVETIKNKLLELIDLGDDTLFPFIKYTDNGIFNYFLFMVSDKDHSLYNKYSLLYIIETGDFSLKLDEHKTDNYFDNGVYILKIHEQLCSKKEEMIKIINQDFE